VAPNVSAYREEQRRYIDDAVEEEENAGGVAVLSGSGEEEDVVVLDEHVGDASIIVHHRRVRLRVALHIPRNSAPDLTGTETGQQREVPVGRSVAYLLVEELGEEALGLQRRDVAAVVAPDEDAALDVQQEQRRHRARHGGRRSRSRPPDLDLRPPLPAAGGGHETSARVAVFRISPRCGVWLDRSSGAGIGGIGSGGWGGPRRFSCVPLRGGPRCYPCQKNNLFSMELFACLLYYG
jgi:hypothetical protein